jgi:hypothetical protein
MYGIFETLRVACLIKETKIPIPCDLLTEKEFYLNYEKSNEKGTASLFVDLYIVLKITKETELQREEKIKNTT